MESVIVSEPEVNVRYERMDVPKNDAMLVSRSPESQKELEQEAFRDDLERKRAKQLEYLEQQLAGFAGFARQRNIEKEATTKRKPVLAVRKTALKSIENLHAVNHENDYERFDESPSYIKGVMRDYQVKGLNWLISLYHNGLNGILADEMGLGKTIQSISMIGYLMHVRKLNGPFLVIVPLTTIDNWMNEFAKFLPSAKVLRAHALGDAKKLVRSKLLAKKPICNVFVTTYEFIVREKRYFVKLNYNYAIIDEGHRAKNECTLFPATLQKCNIQSMVLLTGTPIHNNLHELWALLNLLMPMFFNSANNFDSWFKLEDCLDPLHEQTLRLQKLLKPIMLRRLKAEVCPDIPPKVRILLFVPPTEEICKCSRKLLQNEMVQLKPDGTYTNFRMCNVFPYLRQAALHPFMIQCTEYMDRTYLTNEQIVETSAKMIVLDKLLTRLKRRGSKVLIFSQFVSMLKILLEYFDWRGYEYCVLYGDTRSGDRQNQIEEFNRPGSSKFVFALSTRAGGMGINLHTADTVIFYDIDWNPQMDFQAEDRAHRIGQRKKVHVFRLLVRGTVEEALHSTAERKKQLDESVIQRRLTKSIIHEATMHHQKTVTTVGIIDPSVVDERLDDLFQELDTTDKLQETRVIVLPGTQRLAMEIDEQTSRNPSKRNADEALIVTGKRMRTYTVYFRD